MSVKKPPELAASVDKSSETVVEYLTGPINKLRANRHTGNQVQFAKQKTHVAHVLKDYINSFDPKKAKHMKPREAFSNEPQGYTRVPLDEKLDHSKLQSKG